MTWQELLGDGYSIRETARRVGKNASTISRAARAHGIRPAPLNAREVDRIATARSNALLHATRKANGPQTSIADAVADMKPMEAVRYLIEAYDDLAGRSGEAEMHGLEFGMTPSECRVYSVLLRNEGRTVPHAKVQGIIDHSKTRAGMVQSNMISVHISRIRAKLRGSDLRIATVWGMGYRLDRL